MIAFAWDGFPQYAARCIGAFVKRTSEPCMVVATRPLVPVEGMERLCGCPLRWVEVDGVLPADLPKIDALVVSGWAIPVFNRLRTHVRSSGGRIICMNDANYVPFAANPREWFVQLVRAIVFRLRHRSEFDAFFVPGKSACRLLRFYGVPEHAIAQGMYAADATLFSGGAPLEGRPKRIVYVGQFIPRKNAVRLVEAFSRIAAGDWELHLYGSGELEPQLRSMAADAAAKVVIHDFVQPEALADVYRNARLFVLPSLSEHWGLVVHEAALAGCLLVLSSGIGAADDLLGTSNGFSFNPRRADDLTRALRMAMSVEGSSLKAAEAESRRLSGNASVGKFCDGLTSLLHQTEHNA